MHALFYSVSTTSLCTSETISHICYHYSSAALNNINHCGIFCWLRIYYAKNINASRQTNSLCFRDIDAIQAHKWRNVAIKINDPILQDYVIFKCISIQIKIEQFVTNLFSKYHPMHTKLWKILILCPACKTAGKETRFNIVLASNFQFYIVCGWLDPNREKSRITRMLSASQEHLHFLNEIIQHTHANCYPNVLDR